MADWSGRDIGRIEGFTQVRPGGFPVFEALDAPDDLSIPGSWLADTGYRPPDAQRHIQRLADAEQFRLRVGTERGREAARLLAEIEAGVSSYFMLWGRYPTYISISTGRGYGKTVLYEEIEQFVWGLVVGKPEVKHDDAAPLTPGLRVGYLDDHFARVGGHIPSLSPWEIDRLSSAWNSRPSPR